MPIVSFAIACWMPLASDDRSQRIKALQQAIQSIRKIYDEEAAKVAKTAPIENWYFELPAWPEVAESDWIADYPIDKLELSEQGERRLANRMDQHRFGVAPNNCTLVQRPGEQPALQLQGHEPIRLPSVSSFRWTDSFAWCQQIHLPTEYENASLFHRMRVTPGGDSIGIEVWIENGVVVCSLQGVARESSIMVRTRNRIPTDRWLHFALSYEGLGTAKDLAIYLDGKPCSLEVLRDNLQADLSVPASTPLLIGNGTNRRGLEHAMIKQVQIFGASLTAVEATALATNARFVTWGELTESDRRLWIDHYVRRVDTQCKYHLESLHHYVQSLSELFPHDVKMP
jgi:hypothetical protein